VSHFDSWLGQEIYSILQNVQSSVGAHPAPYSKLSGDAFPRGKDGRDLKPYLYLVSKLVYLFLYLADVGRSEMGTWFWCGNVSEETAR